MKSRTFATIAVPLVAVALLAGCTSTASDTSGQGAAKKVRIALVMSHLTNSFTTTFSQAAKAEAEKDGAELTIFDGKQDQATQNSAVETAVTQQYDGIMVEPVSVDGVKPAVQAANQANIPIMTAVQKMTDQSLAKAFVGGDDQAAGKMQMEKAVQAIGAKGNIAILWGPMGSDSQLNRKKGYDEVLGQNPEVKTVFDSSANWDTDQGLKLMENWLQTGKQIDYVVAQNDAMAIGAAKAIQDAQLKTPVSGIDATPEGLQAITDGRLVGSVSQDTVGQGQLSTQIMLKIIKGETVKAETLTTPVWVTKDNVAQFK
jgi:ribose transport system substrate-binding protein/inositol transport system substrate-binding protein